MEIISRRDAIKAGQRYFFTGKPCKYGHLATRYVGNGACVECLRPKISTALTVAQPVGEIILPESVVVVDQRREQRLAMQREQIEIQKQKLFLKAQELALRGESQTIRKERTERAAVVKSKLTEVNIITEPRDYAGNVLMIWGFAAQRDPRLKPEDMLVRQVDEYRFRFRCFPEDRDEILRVTKETWDRRQAATLLPEIEQKRLIAQAALQAMVDAEDNGEPDGDPT